MEGMLKEYFYNENDGFYYERVPVYDEYGGFCGYNNVKVENDKEAEL